MRTLSVALTAPSDTRQAEGTCGNDIVPALAGTGGGKAAGAVVRA